MIANPAGYYDPCRESHWVDPVLVKSYKPYQIPVCVETHRITTPSVNVPGSMQFYTTLDINLNECLTGRKTPEEACEDTQKAWNKIIKRIGKEKHLASVKESMEAWPTDNGTVPTIKS